MTAKTDLTAQIAEFRRTLAEATKKCPKCRGQGIYIIGTPSGFQDDKDCEDCQGTGHIAHFPEFRQECPCTDSEFEDIPVGQVCKCELAANPDGFIGETNQRGACFGCRLAGYHDSTCPHVLRPDERCNGIGWQVRAGGLEDALVGLSRVQGHSVLDELADWVYRNNALPNDLMPSAPEILAEGLRLVIEIAEPGAK